MFYIEAAAKFPTRANRELIRPNRETIRPISDLIRADRNCRFGWYGAAPAELLRTFYPVRRPKSCGTARKFGVIAAGGADFYPCFGTTIECHTVAGQAILEAAGGRVETLAGAPLTYGKPGFKNDGFLAWGRNTSPGVS